MRREVYKIESEARRFQLEVLKSRVKIIRLLKMLTKNSPRLTRTDDSRQRVPYNRHSDTETTVDRIIRHKHNICGFKLVILSSSTVCFVPVHDFYIDKSNTFSKRHCMRLALSMSLCLRFARQSSRSLYACVRVNLPFGMSSGLIFAKNGSRKSNSFSSLCSLASSSSFS